MEFNFKTANHIIRFSFNFIRRPKEWTTGTMNRTQDGKYVVYADYDLIEEDDLKGELLHFQELMDIGDFHIFQSSPKKFHAISFSKMTAFEYVQFLENSSCDEAFKKVPRFVSYRNWVLRCFAKGDKNKPKYLYTLPHNTYREQSYAHFKLLKVLYPDIPINELKNSDCLDELSVLKYKTGNL